MDILVNKEDYEELKSSHEALKFQLDQLQKLLFGRKSEKYIHLKNTGQFSLFPDQEVNESEEEKTDNPGDTKTEQVTVFKKKKKSRPNHLGKNKFPANLPVEQVILEPEGDISGMKHIGDEITDSIDYTPGVLKIRRTIRPKYVEQFKDNITKKTETRIHIAALPGRPIPKGIPEAGLLAYLFVCKYVDHLPFYRIIERFKRDYGWDLSRVTVSGWLRASCKLFEPLHNLLKQKILDTNYLMVDETRLKVQEDSKNGKCFTGWMWLYEDPLSKLVIYDYQKTRAAEHPLTMLQNFNGHIQVDGYKGYPAVANRLPIKLLICWAHARRKFVEAHEYDKKGLDQVLQYISSLYKIEKDLRTQKAGHQTRYKARQEKSLPLLDKIKTWMTGNAQKYTPKSPAGKAIYYAANRWKELLVYTTDGKFEIDNNLVENSVRPMALGRKNYLFAGSHQAAQYTAMMYSLFTSCRRNDVNPFNWLKDVLQRIPEHSIQRLDELLPDKWQDTAEQT